MKILGYCLKVWLTSVVVGALIVYFVTDLMDDSSMTFWGYMAAICLYTLLFSCVSFFLFWVAVVFLTVGRLSMNKQRWIATAVGVILTAAPFPLWRRTDGNLLLRLGLGFGEGLGGHVFSNKFGGKSTDRIRIGDHGLRIVLCHIAGTAGLTGNNEGALPGGGPIGGTFRCDLAICHEAFGMTDLTGSGSADDEMGVISRRIARDVGIDQLLFMLAGGLAFIQRDQHSDGRIEGLGPEDLVELIVIIPIHIQIERDGDAG